MTMATIHSVMTTIFYVSPSIQLHFYYYYNTYNHLAWQVLSSFVILFLSLNF